MHILEFFVDLCRKSKKKMLLGGSFSQFVYSTRFLAGVSLGFVGHLLAIIFISAVFINTWEFTSRAGIAFVPNIICMITQEESQADCRTIIITVYVTFNIIAQICIYITIPVCIIQHSSNLYIH